MNDQRGGGPVDISNVKPAPAHAVPAALNPLNEADRELLARTVELRTHLDSVLSLVEDGPAAHGLRADQWEDAKRKACKQVERMWRGINDLRDETGAPYRDARMLLTELILASSQAVRDYRAGKGVSAYDADGDRNMIDFAARSVMLNVAVQYPTLKAKMSESARIEAAAKAIHSVARSTNGVPWSIVAAVWHGIGQAHDPERWRKDWNEHRARRNA